MLKKIESTVVPYPDDKELYDKFLIYNKWRCFREELVDHIAEFRSNMDRVLKERCSTIPKTGPISFSTMGSVSRHPTSYTNYTNVTLDKRAASRDAWRTPNLKCGSRLSRNQEAVLATPTTYDDRTLVITHGGRKLNALQMATRSPMLHSRNNRALVSYTRCWEMEENEAGS